MRILKYLGIVFVSTLLSFSFTACGDGDQDKDDSGIEDDSDNDDDDDESYTWCMRFLQMKSMGDYTFTYGYGLRRDLGLNSLYCTSISYKGKKILEIDYPNSKLRFFGYEGKGSYTSDFDITMRDGFITKISGTESVKGSDNDYVKQASWTFSGFRCSDIEYNEKSTYSSGLITYRIIREEYEYTDGKLSTKHIDVNENDGVFDLTESWICKYEYDNPDYPRAFQIPMAVTAGVYSALQGPMRILSLTGMLGYFGDALPSQMYGHYEFTNRGTANFPEGYTALDDRPFEENWGFQYGDWGEEFQFDIFHTESDYCDKTGTPSSYSFTFEERKVTGNDGLKQGPRKQKLPLRR